MKNVENFYNSITSSESLTDQLRTDVFVYFLTIEQNESEAQASDVEKCFISCDLPVPAGFRQYLSLYSKKRVGRVQRYVKTKNGYRLERHYKDQINKILSVNPAPKLTDSVIPFSHVSGSRGYLEELTKQINACYDIGCHDAAAVMMRRLMESLLIEIFISKNIEDKIKDGAGNFFPLDKVLSTAISQNSFNWNRNSNKDMAGVKRLGDTAAHDRTSITHKKDIDDLKSQYRRLIQELMSLAGLSK